MANETARGLFMTITPVNGFTKFVPTPPAPPGPVLLCPYPLNASEDEILSGGAQGKLSMSEGEQTGEHVATGVGGAFAAYASGVFAQTAPSVQLGGTGKKAIEYQIQQLDPLTAPDTAALAALLFLFTKDFSSTYPISVTSREGGTYLITTSGNFGDNTIASGLVAPPTSIGIVYDGGTGEIYVRYDGANYAVTAATLSEVEPILQVSEVEVQPSDVGATARVRLETNAANFIGSYEAGTVDPCGNVIDETPVTVT